MITPKVPPKKPKYTYKLFYKILLFDILMRLTPPLSIFALSMAAVAVYKASPSKSKAKIRSAASDIRQKLSDWIKPDEQDIEEPIDEYEFNENGSVEQDAKKNMEQREADDKSYPPETE